MKKRIISIITVSLAVLMILNVSLFSVRAQDYSFDVDYMQADTYIEKDGSITIEYIIDFYCHIGARPIDWVDIGFPNQYYDLYSIEATINGQNVKSIGDSPYVEHGVEIELGYDILPGESGRLYVKGNNPKMIYGDYEDNSMASVEFSPTWFDDDFCDKYAMLVVNIHFPDGLTEQYGDSVKYHYDEFDSYSEDTDGNLVYTWVDEDLPMKQYMYGVSFPKEYVDSIQANTANPQLVALVINTLIIITLIALGVAIAIGIYRYKKVYSKRYYPPVSKTNPQDLGCSICCVGFMGGFFALMAWAFIGDIVWIILWFIIFIASFGVIGFFIYKTLDKRLSKLPYKKPNIKIDSVGVNTHLSVVEAAIIQNTPLNKVIFLIMFPLIRSGHLKIIDVEPLKFEVTTPKEKKTLKTYQKKFLNAVIETGRYKGTMADDKLRKLLVAIIKATYKKMKGYNLDKTTRYYNHKIAEAWEQVQTLPEEVEWENIEDQFEWLILDEDFKPKSKKYLGDRYYYHSPYWYPRYYYWYHYYPRHYHQRYHSSLPVSTIPQEHINIHSFSDSIVRGMENISNTIVSGFSKFSDSILNAVAPVKKPSMTGASGGRSGGGGGCACACACAGCACACAGGGR